MFVAYSEVLHRTVNVNEVFDLSEVFCCPNRRCTAKLKIKGTTGKKAKHFARLSSTPHIKGCDYETDDSRYFQPDRQKRSTIEDIFGDTLNPNTKPSSPIRKTSKSAGANILYINTPNKLLKFCRMNALDTEYLPGITVADIILDERNLDLNCNYQGINGLRFVIGETYKYQNDKLYLVVQSISKDGRKRYLNLVCEMEPALLAYVKKHILETQNNKFKGYQMAILGNWTTDTMYWSSCRVTNQKHIVLKL